MGVTTATDPFETAEYQKFVESMVPHCRCRESNRPCDGVLAGGLCDDVQDQTEEDDETCEECGYRESLCNCWP